MKKFLMILVCSLTLFYQTLAQVPIPNAGFEAWGNHVFTLSPTHYTSSADFYSHFDHMAGVRRPEGVTKFSPPHSGDYAVKISNVVGRLGSDDTVQDTLSSFIMSSDNSAIDDGIGSGFPCDQRPAVLNGYYQFNQGSISAFHKDTAIIAVVLTKWNTTKEAQDTIGVGVMRIYMTQSSYLFFTVPIDYRSAANPDSAAIVIFSSKNVIIASPSTYLVVDDLSFGGLTTGVKAIDYINGLVPALYPNPVIADVSINIMVQNAFAIDIMDMTGQLIQTIRIKEETATFNLSGLKPGMYLYRIADASHIVLYTERFAKTE